MLDYTACMRWPSHFFYLILMVVILQGGCLPSTDQEVVIYVALDKEFSQPILNDLETELGIQILAKFDQESNKTVGLVTDIIQHRSAQRADLFWNNELLHTIRLQQLGLLEVYPCPAADPFPDAFVSRQHDWVGFAARARVLIVNTDLLTNEAEYPDSIFDLADPQWKDKCAIARPLFGTTATQAAVLFHHLGIEEATQLFTKIAANAQVEGGNKQVARKVARGELLFGLTDTDDAIIEIEQGKPVAIVFPDQDRDGLGTLLIPNTLCLIKNGPNPERAKRLLDRLLQPDIETRLATGRSAQIPLNQNVKQKSRIEPPSLKIMQANFQAAAKAWKKTAEILVRLFPATGHKN